MKFSQILNQCGEVKYNTVILRLVCCLNFLLHLTILLSLPLYQALIFGATQSFGKEGEHFIHF